MPTCFLCQSTVDLKQLRSHFKYRHSKHDFLTYDCIEDGCNRHFNIYSSFRRYLIKNHFSYLKVVKNVESKVSESLPSVSSVSQVTFQESDPLSIFNFEESVIPQNLTSSCAVENYLALYIASFYGNPSLPRLITQSVVNGMSNFMSKSVMPAVNEVLQLHVSNSLISNEIRDSVLSSIKPKLTRPFIKMKTEHARLKYFSQLGTYIAPIPIRVGERLDKVKRGGTSRIASVTCSEYMIPLRQVLKSFFSLKGVLSETLQHMQSLYSQEGCTVNFIQGTLWRSMVTCEKSKVIIPLFSFFDDYESGNVLGSKAGIHKLGAVYVSVPCLPPWRQSVLSNIFLALLFHSSDRVSFGNRVIFQPLIDELNFLSQNGVELEVDGYKGTIYFQLALLLGDNLGIHSITGFIESFSGNFPCRVCKVKKEVMWTQCLEDVSLLRNSSNYNKDLLKNNPSATGVKENCVWLDVKGFQLFENVACDWMHDGLEGVGKYVLHYVLVDLIFKNKFISLETFNERISMFSYGPDSKNKPSTLTKEHLTARNVRLSASEVLTLTRYLTFLVGANVPEGNPTWKLYLAYRQVVDFLLSPIIVKGSEIFFKTLVQELCEIYQNTTKQKLKPKFHNMLHYSRAIEKCGPVIHFWSMRFEAKHRISKMAARASTNRMNLSLSLATKHQLALNEIFLKGELSNILDLGPEKNDVSIFEKAFITLDLSIDSTKLLRRILWFSMSSVLYQKGTILVFDPVPEGFSCDVVFITIDKIYIYDNKQLIIAGITFETVCFDDHLFAFEVIRPDIDNRVAVFFDSLPKQVPHTLHAHSNNKLYITLRSPL